jgi:hypothetical protein
MPYYLKYDLKNHYFSNTCEDEFGQIWTGNGDIFGVNVHAWTVRRDIPPKVLVGCLNEIQKSPFEEGRSRRDAGRITPHCRRDEGVNSVESVSGDVLRR